MVAWSMSEMIRHTVEEHGAALALLSADAVLTYAEVWEQTGALGVHLRTLGLGDGGVVGVALEDPASAVLAMVAVGRAGLTYLPIDPHLPALRVRELATTAGVDLVLVDHDRLPSDIPSVDLRSQPIASLPAGEPAWPAPDRAYLMATSGSSGTPKVAAIGQTGLAVVLRAWFEVYGLHPGQQFLQMASTAFDVFTGDWMRALSCGGTLHLCPSAVYANPARLWAYLEQHRIQFAEFVPVNLRRLARYCSDTGRNLDTFDVLVCGSDLWFVHEFEAVRRLLRPGARLIGSYGTTETTIDNLWYEPSAADLATLDPDLVVPLGTGLPGCTVEVLGADDRLLDGPGSGILLIGGDLVGLGYVGEAGLDDRFRTMLGRDLRRWFVTGDWVSRDQDGTIHLHGRIDRQLKIDGRRVDLGEIESVLRSCPVVAEAAVGTTGAEPDLALVADVVVHSGPVHAHHREVMQYLADRLPTHLVPAICWVPEIRITPNGKVDRRMLAGGAGGPR
jgi:hybrid polyketide synthase / nonribosomal peptide synthetase FtdB